MAQQNDGMDFHTAHDIVHDYYGSSSADCPLCCDKMSEDEAHALADKIVTQRTKMSRGNTMPYVDVLADDKADGVHVKGRFIEGHLKGFTSVVDLFRTKRADDGQLPDMIQVMPLGTFNTLKYGELEITEKDIKQMAENFNKEIKPGTPLRAGVPIDVDHDGKKAAGWIKQLMVMDDGLYAKVEWTRYGKDLVDNKEYRFISPEFDPEYVDPEHSDFSAPNVLIAASLVNRPLFKEMSALTFSEDLTKSKVETVNASDNLTKDKTHVMISTDMNLDELKLRREETLTADEKKFVTENASKLSADEQKVFSFLKAADSEDEDDEDEKKKKKAKADESTTEETTKETVTATEGKVVIEASELAGFRKMADEHETMKLENEVKGWLFSEDGKGKVLPKSKDKIVTFMKSLDEKGRKMFSEIMAEVPEKGKALFSETGGADNSTTGGKTEIINQKAQELMKANDKLTLKEAVRTVLAKEPELGKRDDELQPVASKL